MDDSHPLLATVREILRSPFAVRLPVTALDDQHARRLVGYYSGYELSDDTVDQILVQAEGNSFFLMEMIKEAVESPSLRLERTPASVSEAIWRRFERMDEQTVRVLTTAAAFGRPVKEKELELALSDVDPPVVWNALEEGIRARELRRLEDRFRTLEFVHALIPKTLLEGVGPAALKSIHAHIGSSLEASSQALLDESAPEIANHFLLAGSAVDPLKTASYALKAGKAALAAHAYEGARPWFEAALELLTGLPEERRMIADAYDGLGRTLATFGFEATGQYEAWEYIAKAFAGYVEVGANAQALDAVSVHLRNYSGSTDVLTQALNMAGPGTRRRGWVCTRLANAMLHEARDLDASRTLLMEAISIAEACDDQALLAYAEFQLGSHFVRALMPDQAIQHWNKARQIAEENSDLEVLSRLHGGPAIEQMNRGSPNEAQELLSEGLRASRMIKDVRRIYWGLRHQFELSVLLGDWAAAQRYADEMEHEVGDQLAVEWMRVTVGHELGTVQPHESISRLSLNIQPRADLAKRAFDRASTYGGAPIVADRILESVKIQVRNLPDTLEMQVCEAALLAVARGDTHGLTELYCQLQRSPIRFTFGTGPRDRLLGRAATALQKAEDAERHFQDAIEFCDDAGYRPDLVYCYYDCAMMYITQERESEAAQVVGWALEIAEELQMRPMVALLQEIRPKQDQGKTKHAAIEILSDRQREVLRLIAIGKTNKEIADELIISPNTVARHVANIYEKLGSTNRVGLAGMARDQGIF